MGGSIKAILDIQAYSAAISNAIGVTMENFPITPDKILKAIQQKRQDG